MISQVYVDKRIYIQRREEANATLMWIRYK